MPSGELRGSPVELPPRVPHWRGCMRDLCTMRGATVDKSLLGVLMFTIRTGTKYEYVKFKVNIMYAD